MAQCQIYVRVMTGFISVQLGKKCEGVRCVSYLLSLQIFLSTLLLLLYLDVFVFIQALHELLKFILHISVIIPCSV